MSLSTTRDPTRFRGRRCWLHPVKLVVLMTLLLFSVSAPAIVVVGAATITKDERSNNTEIAITAATTTFPTQQQQPSDDDDNNNNSNIINPIQVRIDPFYLQLSSSNNENTMNLSYKNKETVLGIVEDLITDYSRQYFNNMDNGIEFKYAIMALIEIIDNNNNDDNEINELSSSSTATSTTATTTVSRTTYNQEQEQDASIATTTTTTILQVSGGVAYFGGRSNSIPSQEEMQILVELALNNDDNSDIMSLQDAISNEFTYIDIATYHRGTYGADNNNNNEDDDESYSFSTGDDEDEDDNTTTSGSNDIPTATSNNNNGEINGSSPNQVILQRSDDDIHGNDTDDQKDQFFIIVISASIAGFVVCLIMGILVFLNYRRRKAYWRDDAAIMHSKENIANTMPTKSFAVMDSEDAALEDLEGGAIAITNINNNRKRSRANAKKQSLHMRDSLRQDYECNEQQQDAQSEAGSSLVGRLLNSAATAAAAVNVLSASSIASGSNDGLNKPEKEVDPCGGSHDTSSCSHDSSSSDASIHSNNNNKGNDNDDPDDASTCPSDFEGNAIIKPTIVKPNLADMDDDDRFHDHRHGHNDVNVDLHVPIPPSRTVSARRDEVPISIATINATEPETPFPTPTKELGTQQTRTSTTTMRSKLTQEQGFLSKVLQPLGNVSFPYFGNSTDNGSTIDDNKNKEKGNLSPNTATTTAENIDVDTDARWSDISSDLGSKTDDDFEMDNAWNPDDTSVNSSENGKDVFSPMRSPDEDDIQLLQPMEAQHHHTYNLGKVLCKSPQPPKEISKRRTIIGIDDTAAI